MSVLERRANGCVDSKAKERIGETNVRRKRRQGPFHWQASHPPYPSRVDDERPSTIVVYSGVESCA